jgi:hypothetical protein
VELCFAAKNPTSAIAMALKCQESEHTQEAIRVIDIILRQPWGEVKFLFNLLMISVHHVGQACTQEFKDKNKPSKHSKGSLA